MLVSENLENSDWQLECGQIQQRGARLLASGRWADCCFLLGQDKTPQKAHRLLLAMASPVFQAMFYGPLAEHDVPIPLPDIQPDVFMQLLQYIYTDKIDLKNHKIAIELYFAAQKYMLIYLQQLCTTYISGCVSPESACRIYEFAYSIGDKDLEVKSLKMIKAETKLALSDSSFEHLSLATVISIFSMDGITIDSELDLFEAAERYYLAHQEQVSASADIVNEDDRARSEATFRFTVRNFSNLTQTGVWSPPCYVHGLPWQIWVQPRFDEKGQKHLGVFLSFNKESKLSSCSCEARFYLRLVHQTGLVAEYEEDVPVYLFNSGRSLGYHCFMKWDVVLDSNNGFIKDDSITVQAHVIADEPDGIPLSMKKLSERKDVSIQTLIKQIRFLTLNPKEFADYKPKSSLLTDNDILALVMNINSKETYVALPKMFSRCRVFRKPQMKKK